MKLICCNFKMNLLQKDIDNYLSNINNKINKDKVIFFPSIPYIKDFKNQNYLVGSQDISFCEFGSITGDTSIKQLKELGITWTIIGHSERRKYFDDDKYISKKINLALKNDIKVILCIGENKKTSIEETLVYLKSQIDDAFNNNLNLINSNNLLIAYEPIWAIGSENIPSNNSLEKIIILIKKYILNTYNININILYGGSVNINSINNLEKIKEIDGYLIGGASLKSSNILEIITRIK